jgi:hypothetical protein
MSRKRAAKGSGAEVARIGRPTKCDEALTERVCLRVRNGLRLEAALTAEGIGQATGYEWKARATSDKEADAPYRTFAESVARAQAGFEADMLDAIRQQMTHGPEGTSNEDWKARAWLLERTLPEQYAPTLALVIKARDEATDALLEALRSAPYPLASFADVLAVLRGDEEAEHVEH